MDSLGHLNDSLPGYIANQPPEGLFDQFRVAAKAISSLYTEAGKASKKSRAEGYLSALQDVLGFIQTGLDCYHPNNKSDVKGGQDRMALTIERVIDYIEARQEACKSLMEEDASDSPPTVARGSQQTHGRQRTDGGVNVGPSTAPPAVSAAAPAAAPPAQSLGPPSSSLRRSHSPSSPAASPTHIRPPASRRTTPPNGGDNTHNRDRDRDRPSTRRYRQASSNTANHHSHPPLTPNSTLLGTKRRRTPSAMAVDSEMKDQDQNVEPASVSPNIPWSASEFGERPAKRFAKARKGE